MRNTKTTQVARAKRAMPSKAELEDRAYWEGEAEAILKGELARRKVLYKELADVMSTDDLKVTEAALKAKINRGTFTFGFLVKVMRALGATSVDIAELDRKARRAAMPAPNVPEPAATARTVSGVAAKRPVD